jgi:hypothetical protein
MKRRIRKIVNFFAFNLLFFALYLNFIHKDKAFTQPVPIQTNSAASTQSGSLQDQGKVSAAVMTTSTTTESKADNEALKLSIN